jgi:3-hydroxyacyl-CoA dehydrogenase
VVFERADVMKEVLGKISTIVGSEVVIGTNTSAIPIGAISRQASTGRRGSWVSTR